MNQDAYQTYIGAKGVAFTWVGAAIGPAFLVIGLESEYRAHLIVGIFSLLLVTVSIFDGVRAFKAGSLSGFITFAIVPAILLAAGMVFTAMEAG